MDEISRAGSDGAATASPRPTTGTGNDIAEQPRLRQLERLTGLLIDRLEQAVESEDFSVKELRSYTNTLMDLRQLQLTDPRQLAREQELRLIKLQREAGELAPREVHVSFGGETERASG